MMPADLPDSITAILEPDAKDLGEFTVRRTLPHRERQRVGPFIFWDHMGPADFPPGAGVSVRPHPHIGLATITYLFDGVILHRDSLGYKQPITAGAVNWMTAGRGIVHSERTPEDMVEAGSHLHGIQSWLALPEDLEETEARFEHYPADEMPRVERPGAKVTVIAGSAYEKTSPVQTSSETLYVDVQLDAGASIDVPEGVEELAVYVVQGEVSVDEHSVAEATMALLSHTDGVRVSAATEARVLFLGGAPLEGKRYIWWNFVSSSRERIDQAKNDWREKRFAEVPGDPEFIPLPEN